ncbi:MAG: sterol desaturase family protein [Novosphingobium sp.]|nr:sterol desaturase family protein [Novosphingobium sp.]
MDVRSYIAWITVGAVIVLLAEVFAGRHKGAYARKGEIPLIFSSMAVGRFGLGPSVGILVAMVWSALLPAYRGALADTPLWLAVPGVMLFGEFFFYWVHRYAHQTSKSKSLLWMLHRTHHSARYMNVAVWMRLNLFWYVVIPNAWSMGLAIYLGLGEAAGIYIVLNAVWNIVTHSDFRWDDSIRRHRYFGPVFRAAEHIFVSPGIHHTHHGYGKDGASYRNFGVLLSVWDWVFGTLHIPDGRPYRYGIPGHDAHWLEELAYPLVRIRRS